MSHLVLCSINLKRVTQYDHGHCASAGIDVGHTSRPFKHGRVTSQDQSETAQEAMYRDAG